MMRRRTGPEEVRPTGPTLPGHWATDLAFEHMPGMSGRPIPPVVKRVMRSRRPSE